MSDKKNVALIIAHPDDETLWAGGTILGHPDWNFFIVCLSRGSDPDRAPRFRKALRILKSKGIMGDLDDGPEQKLLAENEIETAIMSLLPQQHFDLIITHDPAGEYTRHTRHEEVSRAVITLWQAGTLPTDELWTFAYEDGNKEYYPVAVKNTSVYEILPRHIFLKKYGLLSETYGFSKNSWEAMTTPRAESFHQFNNPPEAVKWLNHFKYTEV